MTHDVKVEKVNIFRRLREKKKKEREIKIDFLHSDQSYQKFRCALI